MSAGLTTIWPEITLFHLYSGTYLKDQDKHELQACLTVGPLFSTTQNEDLLMVLN